jgi:hypothetical protein
MRRTVKVEAAYDSEAGVWYVQESDLPGLPAEAPTVEELAKKLPGMITDLLEENGWDDGDECNGDTVPIELIAHIFLQAKVSAAA